MEINISYSDLKSIISSKSLLFQHTELTEKYIVYSIDGPLTYISEIYKDGYEPIGIDDSTNIDDFEDNYKSTSNKSLNIFQQPLVQSAKPSYGNRAWSFSHNFADKTTWYAESTRVVDEAVGTGDGSTTVFNLDHTFVIDLSHGKITDEDYLVPSAEQGGSTYIPIIKVNNVTKTEREFGTDSGGDYTINYTTGAITFFTAPTNGHAITATYYYSPANSGSTMFIRPASGTKTIITSIECQMSANVEMTTSMISAVFTYNPGLGAPPAKFEYPGTRATYKKMTDFIGYTNGSYPGMPPIGGSTRGFTEHIYQLRYEYVVSITLDDAYGTELRVWLGNHTPYNGEIAQITFYGYQA